MARGFISITDTGLKDIIQYMEKLGDNYDRILLESLQAMQEPVVERIRLNWTSMVGGKPGGYVFDSVGKSSAFSKTDPHTVVGTVGVYHMDAIAAKHGKNKPIKLKNGKTKKPLNAPQIAYWVEYGMSRLNSGIRRVKGAEYSDDQLITVAAKPFISNAFYATFQEQQNAFSERFNQLMDKIQ